MARPRKSENHVSADRMILPIATRLFAERGFAGTALRDIALASGVSLSSITHHFGDKRELYTTCAKRLFEQASARHRAAVRDAASAAEAIRAFIFAICETTLDPTLAKLMTRDLVDEEHLSLNLIPTNASGFVDEYDSVFDAVVMLYGASEARFKTFAIPALVFGLGSLNDYFQQAISVEHRPALSGAKDLADYVIRILFPDLDARNVASHGDGSDASAERSWASSIGR